MDFDFETNGTLPNFADTDTKLGIKQAARKKFAVPPVKVACLEW